MKKRGLFLLILFSVIAVASSNHSMDAQAQTIKGMKKLKKNQNYYYDLDGDGKKEKIKYIYTYKEVSYEIKGRLNLYINDKKVYSKKTIDSFSGEYSIADFNKKDKKLDLFCMSNGDSGTLNFAIFQQYKAGRIITLKTISNKKLDYGYTRLYRIGKPTKIKNNGKFSFVADTPIYLWSIGSFYCEVPFELKNGKVTHITTNTYGLSSNSKKYTYISNQTISLYQKADTSSSVIKDINYGDKIRILKIKVGDQYKTYSETDGYAYVKDSKGKKGWIYIPKDYDRAIKIFQKYPTWG